MSQRILFGIVALVAMAFSTNSAFAQRDLTAKANGDMRSFWDTTLQPHASRTSNQSYRRYSYAPTQSVPTQMSSGAIVSAAPSAPSSAEVIVSNPVPMAPMSSSVQASPAPSVAVASPASQSYRRYSYQPSTRSNAGGSTHHEPWHYLKTDPRRYQSN